MFQTWRVETNKKDVLWDVLRDLVDEISKIAEIYVAAGPAVQGQQSGIRLWRNNLKHYFIQFYKYNLQHLLIIWILSVL